MIRQIKRNILKNRNKTNKIRGSWQAMRLQQITKQVDPKKAKAKGLSVAEAAMKEYLFGFYFPCNGKSKNLMLGGM